MSVIQNILNKDKPKSDYDKLLNESDDRLVEMADVLLDKDENINPMINGIVMYYHKNNKITDRQKGALAWFISTRN